MTRRDTPCAYGAITKLALHAEFVADAPVLAVFAGWDLIAVHHEEWWFSSRYTLGLRMAGLPVEEWLFFLVVPICALLTYEVLGRGTADLRSRIDRRVPR